MDESFQANTDSLEEALRKLPCHAASLLCTNHIWEISSLITDFRIGSKSIYDGIIQFFIGVWDWLKSVIDVSWQFLKTCFETAFGFIVETVTNICTWVIEQVTFLGKWAMEQILYWADCALKAFVCFIEWLLEQFPDMQLPPDFQEGLAWLIKFGMFLDTILPVRKTLGLIVLYISIVVFIGICRLIYKAFQLIPFI